MNDLTTIQAENLPTLIDRASRALSSARTSAEVLEARDLASVAYDAAKSAGRMARAKQAHDEVLRAVYRAQADAAMIEARAKMRLADEYDAAQDRGEVATVGQRSNVVDLNVSTASDLGLRRDQIHEARKLRDAERAEPGLIAKALDAMVRPQPTPENPNPKPVEPTRAALQRSVLAAVADARKPVDRKNPAQVRDPFRDEVLSFIDHCEQIAAIKNISRIAAYDDHRHQTTVARMHRNAVAALAVLKQFVETIRA